MNIKPINLFDLPNLCDTSKKPCLGIVDRLKKLESIIDNVGTYIFIKDIDGKYTYVNQITADLFGLSKSEIIGKDDSHFFDLDVYNSLLLNDKKVFVGGETIEKEEENYVKCINDIRVFKTVKSPLKDESGNIVGLYGVSTDITAEKTLQRELERQKNILNVVLNNVDAYIYMKSSERNFLYVNEKVADLFGYDADFIAGKKDTEILSKETADHFWQSDYEVFQTQEKQIANEVIPGEDGKIKHYQSVKIPFTLDKGEDALIGFSTDVTELFELKEAFREMAIHDPLTNLFNRRYFVEVSQKEFSRAQRKKVAFSLISLDIDHFKKVNDTYGHPVGDKVLQEVSANLNHFLREQDTLARVGGEEFNILLPETSIEQTLQVAERIRQKQESTPIAGDWGEDIYITFSIGIATLKSDTKNFDEVLKLADRALYKAKDAGRNKTCFDKS